MNWKLLSRQLLNAIKNNTISGIDAEGNAFEPYSTRPFGMAIIDVANKSKLQKMKQNRQAFFYYNRETHKGSVLILGGYKNYKEYMTGSSNVNLTLSGNMLKALTVIDIDENHNSKFQFNGKKYDMPFAGATITIGFLDDDMAYRAWQNETGDGGKRAIRKFVGLPAYQENQIIREFLNNGRA